MWKNSGCTWKSVWNGREEQEGAERSREEQGGAGRSREEQEGAGRSREEQGLRGGDGGQGPGA